MALQLDGLDEVLDALGDGTRRDLVRMLAEGPTTVGALADSLPVSRPAVSKHLKILTEAGLATHTVHGREHHYALDTPGFMRLRRALDRMWDDALSNFAHHMADTNTADTNTDDMNKERRTR